MKLRVIFLKKKHIYYVVLSIIIVILFAVYLSTKKAAPTFNMLVDNNKLIKADLNGDGKEDMLYIKTEKDKYYMEVNTGKNSFFLEPDKKLPTSGKYDSNNPLKITLMDITRDKVPEIFIQSQEKVKAIQHVFGWNGNKFVDMYCSSNSIIGFIDTTNNRSPKFLSGRLASNKIELSSYIFMPDKNMLESFTTNYNSNHMGRDSIFTFIKYIESLPLNEANKPVNIFYPGLSGQDMSLIGRLSGENNLYTFQSCTFRDIKCDTNGEVSEVLWTLNFKAVSITNQQTTKNYTINALLKPSGKATEANYYKIASIKLE
jgi:hypothetical protein